MSTTDIRPTTTSEQSAGEFAERLFGALLGAQEMQAAYLGDRLGWYRALADLGPLTSTELAERTGSTERYAREWLEHQAACGYVTVDDVDAKPAERRFWLPPAHAEVLTDEDSLFHMAPFTRFVGGIGKHVDALVTAYRTGGGVSWAELGDEARQAQGAANRPMFLHQLGQELLPSAPEVHARLQAGGTVADVGCGFGWSSIGIALRYPGVTVDGFDVDGPSIEAARRHAEDAGVADRVRFQVADGSELDVDRRYDVVFAFECVHDLSDPVGVLAALRRLAGPEGIVVVMDERTEPRFVAPAPEVERMLYGFSIVCCLPDSMSTSPSAATGTVMRASTLTAYAQESGFASVEVLPIDHDFFRFYRLHP